MDRGRKNGKPLGSAFPHYMNKNERKELARLCQKSGDSPEKVKENVVNRRKLADAQKSQTRSDVDFRRKCLMKIASYAGPVMKLHPLHPDVQRFSNGILHSIENGIQPYSGVYSCYWIPRQLSFLLRDIQRFENEIKQDAQKRMKQKCA